MAHKWGRWLHNLCPLGGPHCFRAGDGYKNPAALGVPTALGQQAESEVAHKWGRWLHNPSRLVISHGFRAGGRITSGPLVGKVATKALLLGGSLPLQSGGQYQRRPTSEQGGYIPPAGWGVRTASQQAAE